MEPSTEQLLKRARSDDLGARTPSARPRPPRAPQRAGTLLRRCLSAELSQPVSPTRGCCRGRWEGPRSVQTAGKPCPPRAVAPSASPPGMGAGLQTVDKLLAFKLESDSSLLARGAGNCAQEQVRRDPTLTRRRRMKFAGSTPPSRQPGAFPPDAFSFSLPLLFFHRGSKIRVVWPHRPRASQAVVESHPPAHGGGGEGTGRP